ncbi:FISUMP domain-containing protein [Chryseobacterium sp. S90]|uniref:FISUMP domain-containing protein n=1 Tax=Chryseobacterium sp. S90 TaxID=3395373 RepID=UPI0039BCD56E
MRKMYLLPMVFIGALSYGQVGINSLTPKSTLDVTSKTSDGSAAEGFILPRVTGNALHAAEAAGVYGADQDATLAYVTAAPDPANRTGQVEGMDDAGFYYFNAGSNRWVKMVSSGTNTAAVTQMLCSASTDIGVLEAGEPAAGINTSIPYNGGNGGIYSPVSVPSTGVTGLTATLPSGTLNNGSGTFTFNITGTPSAAGTAVFTISIAGETCGFTRTVAAAGSSPDVVPVIINGQIRQMMTHNLGAETFLDPNSLNQAITGNYYQWGKLNPVATAYVSTAISGWSTAAAANKAWNSGTEAVPVKTANDPCPAGFRVPTRNEWVSFITNSPNPTNIGTFVASPGSPTNFTAGKKFVNNGSTLVFPAAGGRNDTTGALGGRAYNGYYWSSTENSTKAYGLNFTSSTVESAGNYTRANGFSVRCVSE